MFDTIKNASIAKWFNGCYKNEEDSCFLNIGDKDSYETVKEEKMKVVIKPLPKLKVNKVYNILTKYLKLKDGATWKTNGASKMLGLSVLLDPATHDNINSNNHMKSAKYY